MTDREPFDYGKFCRRYQRSRPVMPVPKEHFEAIKAMLLPRQIFSAPGYPDGIMFSGAIVIPREPTWWRALIARFVRWAERL